MQYKQQAQTSDFDAITHSRKPQKSKFQFTRSSPALPKQHSPQQFKHIIEEKKNYQSMIKQELLKLERLNKDEDPEIQPFIVLPQEKSLPTQTTDKYQAHQDENKIMALQSFRQKNSKRLFVLRLKNFRKNKISLRAASYFHFSLKTRKIFNVLKFQSNELQEDISSMSHSSNSVHTKREEIVAMLKRAELRVLLSAAYGLKLKTRTRVFEKISNIKRKKHFLNQWAKMYRIKSQTKQNQQNIVSKLKDCRKIEVFSTFKQRTEVSKKLLLLLNIRRHRSLLNFLLQASFINKENSLNATISKNIAKLAQNINTGDGDVEYLLREYFLQTKRQNTKIQGIIIKDFEDSIPPLFQQVQDEKEEMLWAKKELEYKVANIKVVGWFRKKQAGEFYRHFRNQTSYNKLIKYLTDVEVNEKIEGKNILPLFFRKDAKHFIANLRLQSSLSNKSKRLSLRINFRKFTNNAQSDLQLERKVVQCLAASKQWLARSQLNQQNRAEVVSSKGQKLLAKNSKYKKGWLRYAGKLFLNLICEKSLVQKRLKFSQEILGVLVKKNIIRNCFSAWKDFKGIEEDAKSVEADEQHGEQIEEKHQSQKITKELFITCTIQMEIPASIHHLQKVQAGFLQSINQQQDGHSSPLKSSLINCNLSQSPIQDNVQNQGSSIMDRNEEGITKNIFEEQADSDSENQGDQQSQLLPQNNEKLMILIQKFTQRSQKILFAELAFLHKQKMLNKHLNSSRCTFGFHQLCEKTRSNQLHRQKTAKIYDFFQTKEVQKCMTMLRRNAHISQCSTQLTSLYIRNCIQKWRTATQCSSRYRKGTELLHKMVRCWEGEKFFNCMRAVWNIGKQKLQMEELIEQQQVSGLSEKLFNSKNEGNDCNNQFQIQHNSEQKQDPSQEKLQPDHHNGQFEQQQQVSILVENLESPQQQPLQDYTQSFDNIDNPVHRNKQKGQNGGLFEQLQLLGYLELENKAEKQIFEESPFKEENQSLPWGEKSIHSSSSLGSQFEPSVQEGHLTEEEQQEKEKEEKEEEEEEEEEDGFAEQYILKKHENRLMNTVFTALKHHNQKKLKESQIKQQEELRKEKQKEQNKVNKEEEEQEQQQSKYQKMKMKKLIFEGLCMHWRQKKSVRMFLKQYDEQLSYYPSSASQYQQFKAIAAMCPE